MIKPKKKKKMLFPEELSREALFQKSCQNKIPSLFNPTVLLRSASLLNLYKTHMGHMPMPVMCTLLPWLLSTRAFTACTTGAQRPYSLLYLEVLLG
jgi:hypothetical protein